MTHGPGRPALWLVGRCEKTSIGDTSAVPFVGAEPWSPCSPKPWGILGKTLHPAPNLLLARLRYCFAQTCEFHCGMPQKTNAQHLRVTDLFHINRYRSAGLNISASSLWRFRNLAIGCFASPPPTPLSGMHLVCAHACCSG